MPKDETANMSQHAERLAKCYRYAENKCYLYATDKSANKLQYSERLAKCYLFTDDAKYRNTKTLQRQICKHYSTSNSTGCLDSTRISHCRKTTL